MSNFSASKVLTTPKSIQPNTVYFIKSGSKFTLKASTKDNPTLSNLEVDWFDIQRKPDLYSKTESDQRYTLKADTNNFASKAEAIKTLTIDEGFLKYSLADGSEEKVFPLPVPVLDNVLAFSTQQLASKRDFSITGAATASPVAFDGTDNVQLEVTSVDAESLKTGIVPNDRLSGTYDKFNYRVSSNNSLHRVQSTGSPSSGGTGILLAEFIGNSQTTTGAIVFTSPIPKSGEPLFKLFNLRGFLYSPNEVIDIELHNYSNSTGSAHSESKVVYGTTDIKVRCGWTPEGKWCIVIGDTNSTWSFPHFTITSGMFGDNGFKEEYFKGWTTNLTTSIDGYTNLNEFSEHTQSVINRGGWIETTSGALLDSYKTNGKWFIKNGNVGRLSSDGLIPSAWLFLEVETGINGRTKQRVTLDNTGQVFTRILVDTVWKPWNELTFDKTNTNLTCTDSDWHTIAMCSTRSAQRAFGEFYIIDETSGKHQSLHFIASHIYGQSTLTMLSSNSYASSVITDVRIIYGSTYHGALIQIKNASAINPKIQLINNLTGGGWVLAPTGSKPKADTAGETSFINGHINKEQLTNVTSIITTRSNGLVTSGNVKAKSIEAGDNSPRLMYKKLTGSLPSNGTIVVAHGLDASKILSVEVVINSTGGYIDGTWTASSGAFSYFWDDTNIKIVKTGNGSIINGRPFTILLTYEE